MRVRNVTGQVVVVTEVGAVAVDGVVEVSAEDGKRLVGLGQFKAVGGTTTTRKRAPSRPRKS